MADHVTIDPADMPSVGDRLRLAREARELNLRDVALKTRQSQDTLAALEAMETTHISPTILRMQARTYARFLELPEDEIVSGFATERGQTNADEMPDEVVRVGRMTSKRALLVGLGVTAAIAAASAIFLAVQPSPVAKNGELDISARVTPQVTPDRASDVLRSADEKAELAILARRAGWIEVRGSDGTVFRSRTMSAGETYYPRMSSGWTVTVRDAGAFDWKIGDQIVGPIGADNTPLFSISIDEATREGKASLSEALADRSADSPAPR